MSENNDFALVPRAPNSLEKAVPGGKRILSDMVADTLALAKKAPARTIKVLVGWADPNAGAMFELLLRFKLKDTAIVSITAVDHIGELLDKASREHFDLCMIHLWGVFLGRIDNEFDFWERGIAAVKALKVRGVNGVIVSSL